MNDPMKSNGLPPSDAEPTASHAPLPVWIILPTLVSLVLGVAYFNAYGAWFNRQVYAPYDSAQELARYQPKAGQGALLAQGRAVYDNVCSTCHGADGMGKAGQAPPLACSEWVAGDIQKFAHVPLAGLHGRIQVKGKTWNLSMPPVAAAFSNAKLAAVLSYVRSAWGNHGPAVAPRQIQSVRAGLKNTLPPPAVWAKMSSVERGRAVFVRYGCAQCHGSHGQGGVRNPNAKSGQQVPALIHVADGYTKAELIAFIEKGQRHIARLNPKGPAPPRFMPSWGAIISKTHLEYLADYLFSLKPKEDDLGF